MSRGKLVRLAGLSAVCLVSVLYICAEYEVDFTVIYQDMVNDYGDRMGNDLSLDHSNDTNRTHTDTVSDIPGSKKAFMTTTVIESEDSEPKSDTVAGSVAGSETVGNNTQDVESTGHFAMNESEAGTEVTFTVIKVKSLEKVSATFIDNVTEAGDTTLTELGQTVIIRNDSTRDIIKQHNAFDSTTESTFLKADLPLCPPIPNHLVGRLKVTLDERSWTEIEDDLPNVKEGGEFLPSACDPKYSLAIILPFRNRDSQLRIFLNFIHPILMRQNIHYRIFVISQDDKETFNRAMLFNVGFSEASKMSDWDCFVFHDVDLLPEDDRNLYTCPDMPRHMSVSVNKFNYKLPYKDLFGGVSAISKEHFKLVNGFSNQFWGWGGEDDDMSRRVRDHNLTITRYTPEIARYTMINHTQEVDNKPNPKRFKLLKNSQRFQKTDGLNNLKYNLHNLTIFPLYTRVSVQLTHVDYKLEPIRQGRKHRRQTSGADPTPRPPPVAELARAAIHSVLFYLR
eukprot:GFUD01030359.1.p1 GENE.GFUD01030359.1~~GFUD01030359.1.p1  ORF type:complete len:509 (+),score=123.71 GFUD01030359.1:129-1655(+)